MNSRKRKRLFRRVKILSAYVYMPIIFASIGFLTLYISLSPVIKNVNNVIALITSDSASLLVEELSDNFKGSNNNEETVKAVEVDYPEPNSKFAELKCERLGLNVPVYHGDTDMCLHYGCGIPFYSNIPGFKRPVMVAGHNSTFFAPLEDIQEGDVFVFTTNYGVYEYKVRSFEVKPAKDFDPKVLVEDGSDILIVYTCYPFTYMRGKRTDRLFITCDRISGPIVSFSEVTSG